MDWSQFSTDDLRAIQANDWGKVSTEGLLALRSTTAAKPEFQPIPDEPGFFKALGTSAKSSFQALAPAAKLMVSPESQGAAEELRGVGQTAEEAYRRTQFSDIGERAKAGDVGGALGATWDKFKELAGESIGFQVPAAGVGLAAAGAAALAPAALPAAAIGTAAYGVTLLGQYVASNLGRQLEENKGKPIERLPASAAGAGQAALDLLGGKFLGLGKILGLEGKAASEMALKELTAAATNPVQYKRAVAVGAAKGIAFEVPQEITQSVLERWQAGLPTNPFDDPGAAKEYAEAAAGALMLGGPLGAVGRVGAARANRAEAIGELRQRGEEEVRQEQDALGPMAVSPSGEQVSRVKTSPDEGPEPEKFQDTLDEERRQYEEDLRITKARFDAARPHSAAYKELKEELEKLGKQYDFTKTREYKSKQKELEAAFTGAESNEQGLFVAPKETPNYPGVPDVPAPLTSPAGSVVTEGTLQSLGISKSAKYDGRLIRDVLYGLNLDRADDLNTFIKVINYAEKRGVKLDSTVAEQLFNSAVDRKAQRKPKQASPVVIGEQPTEPGLTPEQQAFFEQQREQPTQPGVELSRAQARLPTESSSIFVPEERQPQVGGRPLLEIQKRPRRNAKEEAAPTEPWVPELVTEETLDKLGISKSATSKPVAALRNALYGGRDLNNTEDRAAVRDALRAYRNHALVSAAQKSKVDQAIRSLGLAGQQSLDLSPRPDKETTRVDRPEDAGESVVAPVPQRAADRPGAAGDRAPAVDRDQGRTGAAPARAETAPDTVTPQQDAKVRRARAALAKAGYENVDELINEITDPVKGLDESALGELLELRAKPVGPKLTAKAAAAVQAGDIRGALRAISETGSTPLVRAVAKKLLGYVGGTKIKVGDIGGSGQYDPPTDTITINPNALYEHTILHEMVHAAISHVLRNKSHPLTRQLADLYMKLLPRIQNTYGGISLQEFASEAQSNPEFRAMLRSIRVSRGPLKTAWDHVVDAVRKFLGMSPRQSQTTLDKIDKTIDELLTAGKAEAKTPGDILFLNADVSGSAAAYQQFLNSVGNQTRALPELSQGWLDSVGKLSRGLVSAITKTLDLNHLVEIYGDRVPSLRGMVNLLNEQRGYTNTQLDRAGKNARMLKRLFDKYHNAPSKVWDTFTNVVYDSTLSHYDPSKPADSGNIESDNAANIQSRYNKLPDDLKQAYKDIKEHYADLYKDYLAALEKDLIALPEAERASIRAAIENKIKPYFPLMRFGDYWLEFERNGQRYVTAFESPEERTRTIAALKLDTKAPGFRIYKKLEEVLSRPPSDPMIQRTLKALKDTGVDKETVDRVHRVLLQMNPQQSAIMNMIKREGYPGYSKDLIRTYSSMTPRIITQTASRMYNRSIEEVAGYARVQLEEISNANPKGYDSLADAVAEELSGKQGSRLDVILNPRPNSLASTLNWLTFGYFMGANVSTAIINLTQTPMVAYPLLASRFGLSNATRAMMDAYKFYGNHAFKNTAENFKTHGYLSPLNTMPKNHPLSNLYSELQRRGQINISLTQEILDLQEQPTDKTSKVKQRVGVAMSFAHQLTEMSNREITAVAAYNLAKQAKMSDAAAVDYAIDTVTKSHGSGMLDTAGPIFQHPVGRVVLMFKRFAQLMVFRAARTAYVAIKGDASLSAAEQADAMRMAKKQLLGIYLMAFAFSGAQGLPLYGLVEMLYNIFQSAFGDEMEYHDFNNLVRDAIGDVAYKGAVNAATGRDIAQRTGFGDLLIRDDSRSMAELGPFMYYFQQFFGGAFLSAANNLNRGFGMINDGNIYRGLETMSPAAVRNVMKGVRFWSEGATTLKGDPITDNVGVHDALFQMSGFAPTKLTEIYEKRGFMKEYETFVKDKRRSLLDQYELALDSGDSEALDDVQDRVSRFNDAYPEVRITSKTIAQSIKGRQRREQEAVYGVQIDKRLRERVKEAVAGGTE
jgi:hypothetical protein